MDTFGRHIEPESLLRDLQWVRELSRHLVRDPASADDVAQDTWLAALRAWPAESPSRRWLARIARNVAHSRRRGETRRDDYEADAAREAARVDPPAPEELVARMEMQRRLAACVLALPDPYRSTILWRYVEGRSPREIARRLGVPAATVRSRASRGLELLRVELDRASGGDRREWFGALSAVAAHAASHAPGPATIAILGGTLVTKIVGACLVSLALIAAAWYFASRSGTPDVVVDATRRTSVSVPTTSPTANSSSAHAPGDATERASANGASDAAADAERRTPLTPESAAPARDELVLRLLDASTGEPVPRSRVVLVAADGTREELESDAHGLVRATRTRRAPDATLELVVDVSPNDHHSDLVQTNRAARQSLVRTVAVRVAPKSPRDPIPPTAAMGASIGEPAHGATEAVDVRVPTGPRWFLARPLPAGARAADMTARLTCADPRKAFDKLYAVLHDDDDGLWVRFSDTSRLLSGGPPWKVFVGSEDGLWAASFTSETIVGTQRAPVVLEFASTSRVQGRLLDADGRPHGDEWVQWIRPGATFRDADNRPLLVRADAEGRFDARHVPPGDYEVRVEATGRWPLSRALTLRAGETQSIDLTLTPRPTDGSLDVRITSETGTYTGSVRVSWTLEEGQRDTQSKVPEWSGSTARWLVEHLVRSTFTVRATALDGTPITPKQVSVASDGREVSFLVRDRTPMVELAFRATDADTHEPVTLEGCTVTVVDPSDPDPPLRGVDLATMRTRMPRAERYVVQAQARGHRPIEVVVAPRDEEVTEITLRKGWGSLVSVLDPDGRPLVGARITCDEVDVGLTDERGRLRVELDAPPRGLFAHLDGWRDSGAGDTDPRTGAFREWQASTKIRMERVPR